MPSIGKRYGRCSVGILVIITWPVGVTDIHPKQPSEPLYPIAEELAPVRSQFVVDGVVVLVFGDEPALNEILQVVLNAR